jgi:hypothetical protein
MMRKPVKMSAKTLSCITKQPWRKPRSRRAEHVAAQKQLLQVTCVRTLKELGDLCCQGFWWDDDKPQVAFNQLVITQDQLGQGGAARHVKRSRKQ